MTAPRARTLSVREKVAKARPVIGPSRLFLPNAWAAASGLKGFFACLDSARLIPECGDKRLSSERPPLGQEET